MLYIHGIGHFHPENEISNAFLEGLDIGTDPKWIMERVGIESRRTVLSLDYIHETRNVDPNQSHAASLYSNAQTGAMAALMAIERAGIQKSKIGMVVAGGCSPQFLIPAEACLVAAELEIQAPSIDVSSACSSFASQIHFLSSMQPEALPPYILLVNCENNTRTIDYRDRNTAVLWGDATSAAVVSTRIPSRMKVVNTTLSSDPSGWAKVRTPVGGHFAQLGAEVQAFAIRKTVATLESLKKLNPNFAGKFSDNFNGAYFIGHQANLRMLNKVCEKMKIPSERHLHNIGQFGNCGAAGAPSVISQNWDRFVDQDLIAVALVGAGLTWGGFIIEVSLG